VLDMLVQRWQPGGERAAVGVTGESYLS